MPDQIIDSTQTPDQTAPDAAQLADQAQPEPAKSLGEALNDHLDALDKAIEALPDDGSFVLPSGVTCVMSEGKGRHLLAAQRMSGQDPNQIMYALLASLCTFDGAKRVMEDILEMGLADVMRLTAKFSERFGGDFLPSTSGPSSTSPQ
jgi:hypothetical protein